LPCIINEVAAVSAPSVTLSGFTNLLPYIKMEVKDSTLRIYVKEVVSLHTEKNLEARIILPSLAGISTSGSSDVNVTGNVTGPALEIDISGAGDAVLQSVNVSDLNIDLSGAASVTIQSGTVNKAEYEASGAGHIYAYGLQTTLTSVDFSGAGSAEVTASQTLDVEVSGAGSVSYKGHPSINKSISGVGSVTDAN